MGIGLALAGSCDILRSHLDEPMGAARPYPPSPKGTSLEQCSSCGKSERKRRLKNLTAQEATNNNPPTRDPGIRA